MQRIHHTRIDGIVFWLVNLLRLPAFACNYPLDIRLHALEVLGYPLLDSIIYKVGDNLFQEFIPFISRQ